MFSQARLRPFFSFSLLTTKLQLIIFLISLAACLAVPRSLCYPRISAEINSKSNKIGTNSYCVFDPFFSITCYVVGEIILFTKTSLKDASVR